MKYTQAGPNPTSIELVVDPDGDLVITTERDSPDKFLRMVVYQADVKEFCERVAQLADEPHPDQPRGTFED